jgi:hypothetical protein
MIFGDANLPMQSHVRQESKCVGVSRLSLKVVCEIKAFDCLYF